MAEQNNELLMKNHEARPTGSAPFPEVNVATSDPYNHGRGQDHNNNRGHNFGRGRSHGLGRGRSHGLGRGRAINHGHGHGYKGNFKEKLHQHKWNKNAKKEKERGEKNGKKAENICYRCGSKSHWTCACYTPKHLVELYQESLKKKNIKTTLLMKMVIMIMAIWILFILILVISFLNSMEALITLLVMGVLENSFILFYIMLLNFKTMFYI